MDPGSWVLSRWVLHPGVFGLGLLILDPGSWVPDLGSWVLISDYACYMRDLACRWFIAENAKIFRSYVKHC